MDHSQNLNHNCSCTQPSEVDDCSYGDLPNASSEQISRRNDNSKCNMADASEDELKAEIADIRVELEDIMKQIESSEEDHIKRRDDVSKKFCDLSDKYKEMSEKLVKLQKKNKCLQEENISKTLEEKLMTKETEQLECIESQYAECNKKLENDLKQLQGCVDEAKRQLAEADKTIACRTAEVENLRCQVSATDSAFRQDAVRHEELLRRGAEYCRLLDELTAEHRELDARLAAARETGSVRLQAAERTAEAARAQLADVGAALDDWLARNERAGEKLRCAQAERDQDACRGRDELARLSADVDRLAAQLTETADRLTAAVCDNRHLAQRTREKKERLDGEAAEVRRLERLVDDQRQQHAAQLAVCDMESKVMEARAADILQRLAVNDQDMELLRRARDRRELLIKNAVDQLNEMKQQQQQQQRPPPTRKKTDKTSATSIL